MKFACRDIRYITDRLTRHEKAFLKSFLSGVYAGVILYIKMFTHRTFFIYRFFYIEKPLHTDAFTSIYFYTQKHTRFYTQRRFYTQTLFYREAEPLQTMPEPATSNQSLHKESPSAAPATRCSPAARAGVQQPDPFQISTKCRACLMI